MKGDQYEQFVKAVLIEKLNIKFEDLISTKEQGVTFPGDPKLQHQIDLFYLDQNEIAQYITIIECKYRTSGKVDQEEIAKLAYVKGSIKASKAIMVTNTSFTSGAMSIAKAENIALLVITPDLSVEKTISVTSKQDVFEDFQKLLQSKQKPYEVQVVRRLTSDPNEKGIDLIDGLLADPDIRMKLEELSKDPEIQIKATDFLNKNPEIAKSAIDFLRKRW